MTENPINESASTPEDRPAIRIALEALARMRAAKARASSRDIFVYRGKIREGTKRLPPQAQTIVNAIEAAGIQGISRQELLEVLRGTLYTSLPENRVLAYYQKTLIDRGYIELIKADLTPTDLGN